MKNERGCFFLKERVDRIRCKPSKELCRHLYVSLIIAKMPISPLNRGICTS